LIHPAAEVAIATPTWASGVSRPSVTVRIRLAAIAQIADLEPASRSWRAK